MSVPLLVVTSLLVTSLLGASPLGRRCYPGNIAPGGMLLSFSLGSVDAWCQCEIF